MMYDELRRLQVQEKQSNNLSAIKPDTYQRIFAHIEQLKSELAKKWDTHKLRELENCEKVLREVEMKRAEKITLYAFNEVYNGFGPLQGLADEERPLYEGVKRTIQEFKGNIGARGASREMGMKSAAGNAVAAGDEPPVENSGADMQAPAPFIKVKLLKSVPRFKAGDGNEYGPFDAGAVAELPAKAAEVMLKRGIAEVYGSEGSKGD
ncbi:MAG: hypothetical protein N3H30_01910 [Candidatus Micrarchaeota archaeon]|nr:hypothetical protein [Candidatus Micrarchaeota archaeon]